MGYVVKKPIVAIIYNVDKNVSCNYWNEVKIDESVAEVSDVHNSDTPYEK